MDFHLNFHGIGRPTRPFEPGEEPYWISRERFIALLDAITASSQPVRLTFDDGNASDYDVALPILRARKLPAIFFVVAGRLDQPGFLTSDQVAEIDADPLFSIGSHGMGHRPWSEISAEDSQEEIEKSRSLLSRICGRSIEDAGLPFGKFDSRTLKQLRAAGYQTVYSSDGMPRLRNKNPVSRFSVRNDTPAGEISHMFDNASFLRRLSVEIRSTIKARL